MVNHKSDCYRKMVVVGEVKGIVKQHFEESEKWLFREMVVVWGLSIK